MSASPTRIQADNVSLASGLQRSHDWWLVGGDFFIKAEETHFKVHKAFLQNQSVLQDLLGAGVGHGSRSGPFALKAAISAEDMGDFLRLIHESDDSELTGRTPLAEDDCIRIARTADRHALGGIRTLALENVPAVADFQARVLSFLPVAPDAKPLLRLAIEACRFHVARLRLSSAEVPAETVLTDVAEALVARACIKLRLLAAEIVATRARADWETGLRARSCGRRGPQGGLCHRCQSRVREILAVYAQSEHKEAELVHCFWLREPL